MAGQRGYPEGRLDRVACEAVLEPQRIAERIEQAADVLERSLERFIRDFSLDVLVVQNALAIPMHVALGLALAHERLGRVGLARSEFKESLRLSSTDNEGYRLLQRVNLHDHP